MPGTQQVPNKYLPVDGGQSKKALIFFPWYFYTRHGAEQNGWIKFKRIERKGEEEYEGGWDLEICAAMGVKQS